MTILKNWAKIKTLEGDLNQIVIRHDMSDDQRSELYGLNTVARSRQENNIDSFLYRVRGEVGKWRIVKLKNANST